MKRNRQEIIDFLKSLRETIIANFESLEPKARFQRRNWNYHRGPGGGEISEIRGDVFERAAVNWSAVSGDQFPADESKGPFFATGVSLITHMVNPKMPTVHMNVRYIEVGNDWWVGGGYDLTPMGFVDNHDTAHFHTTAKQTLDRHDPTLYPKWSQWAKEYFFVKHRNRERGVGGIFFDHFQASSEASTFSLWSDIGKSFCEAIMPIYKKHVNDSFRPEDKEIQYRERSVYVEYNLLYDRGTKFGFQSGGNPDAILCSMPPIVKW